MRTVFDYAKLSAEDKNRLLNDEAILFDKYEDGENTIYVYYLHGFFVELTIRNGIITDNLPYKRGYRFNKKNSHALEKRNTLYCLAA